MGAENSKVNRLSLRKDKLSEIERIRFEAKKGRKGRSKTVQCEKYSRNVSNLLVNE